MTRLLFLPNDQTFLLLDSPLPAREVVEAVLSGQWAPPEPYSKLLAELQHEQPLHAFRQGGLVIITTALPLDLEARTVAAPASLQSSMDFMLTPRQQNVLQCLSEGMTTKEIAVQMGVSTRTIAMHIASINQRLGTNTRAQLVARAAALGLCKPGRRSSQPGV